MNAEQNIVFMNDKRRIEAQNKLDKIVRHIQQDIFSSGSAQYYLSTLPQLMKELSDAYENLAVVEATVESEITGKIRYHGYAAPNWGGFFTHFTPKT